MPSLKVGLVATAIYLAVIAIGMAITVRVYDTAYGTPLMISHFWATELVLVSIVLFFIWRFFGFARAGFGPMKWSALVWFLPAYIVLFMMIVRIVPVVATGHLTPDQMRLLGWITLTTFLIGFSEEVLFRGILLRGAMASLTVIQAMFLSTVAFSLLHAVNVFGGLPLGAMIYQLAFTFIVGFFLAPLALRLGNLWPLIIWHWLWDFALFAGDYLGVSQPLILTGLMVQVVIALTMWSVEMRRSASA